MRASGMTVEADKLQGSNYDGAVKYQDSAKTDGQSIHKIMLKTVFLIWI